VIADDKRGVAGSALSIPDVSDLRANTPAFEAIAAEAQDSAILTEADGRARSTHGYNVELFRGSRLASGARTLFCRSRRSTGAYGESSFPSAYGERSWRRSTTLSARTSGSTACRSRSSASPLTSACRPPTTDRSIATTSGRRSPIQSPPNSAGALSWGDRSARAGRNDESGGGGSRAGIEPSDDALIHGPTPELHSRSNRPTRPSSQTSRRCCGPSSPRSSPFC